MAQAVNQAHAVQAGCDYTKAGRSEGVSEEDCVKYDTSCCCCCPLKFHDDVTFLGFTKLSCAFSF